VLDFDEFVSTPQRQESSFEDMIPRDLRKVEEFRQQPPENNNFQNVELLEHGQFLNACVDGKTS
jgi:hypothetical protein